MTVLLLLRRSPIMAAALVVATATTRAADSAGVWTVTPAFTSQSLFRGTRLAGPSIQSSADYTAGGFTGGLWATGALRREIRGTGRSEVDLYGSWGRKVFTDTLELVPGLTVYGFPSAARGDGEYPVRVEPSAGLNVLWQGVRLTPKLYYDLMREGPTAELNAAVALPLARLGTEIDLFGNVGAFRIWNAEAGSAVHVRNSGCYWLASVSMPYQIRPNARLALGFSYSEGLHNTLKRGGAPEVRNPEAVSRLSVTVSCSITR